MKTIKGVDIERVRAYWDAGPCNIRHSTLAVGTREYFDEVEARKYFVEPHIPAFADFPKWRGKNVLELGCGMGTDAVNFARAGADYSGVELSKESLRLAKKRFSVFNLKGNFYHGNAEELSAIMPPQKFDLIYSFGVIHHTPNPKFILNAVKSFMRFDSEMRLMVYAKNSWKQIAIEAGYEQPEAQAGCPIAFTYTREEIHNLLEGFEILEIRQEHIFPFVIEKYIEFKYEKTPWFKAMPDKLFRALEKSLGWHMLIRCRLA